MSKTWRKTDGNRTRKNSKDHNASKRKERKVVTSDTED